MPPRPRTTRSGTQAASQGDGCAQTAVDGRPAVDSDTIEDLWDTDPGPFEDVPFSQGAAEAAAALTGLNQPQQAPICAASAKRDS